MDMEEREGAGREKGQDLPISEKSKLKNTGRHDLISTGERGLGVQMGRKEGRREVKGL